MTIVAWIDLKTTDFASLDRERTVAVLPVAAVEQHGPHLPTGTDSLVLTALLKRLRERPLSRGKAVVLPLLPVGLSPEHAAFPGTLTTSAETLLAYWCDIGRSVARAGIRRLVILNSHGGNASLSDVAALRLRAETGLLVVSATTHRFGVPAGIVPADELRYGVHAGAVETALVLAIAPHLVDDGARTTFATRERPITALNPQLGAAGGAARLAWLIQDLHPAGAVGDATLADARIGEAVLAHLVDAVHRLLDDVLALDPGSLQPAVPGPEINR